MCKLLIHMHSKTILYRNKTQKDQTSSFTKFGHEFVKCVKCNNLAIITFQISEFHHTAL